MVDPTATTWPMDRPDSFQEKHASLPREIGPYRIEREIGAGGMGRVYEATDLTLSRHVAIKVIRPGMASQAAADRFILESQTLAKFTHPGIAQIFAAGHYEDPRSRLVRTPYFVMEYVPGAKPITEYAAAHRLDIDAIVRLFIKVCESIEHAHRHRIIHRDLKPSNIVVCDFPSAQGVVESVQPKVIDFGIARHIESTTPASASKQLVGTLEYMSPEQCIGEALDERTDVYSLALVLYQLLAGTLPYPVQTAGTTQDIISVICGTSPLPLASHGGSLAGDLNAVVMRGLSKRPSDRYASVARFRADLERYLAGEAVEARWNSVAYLASRRVRAWLGFHPRASLISALAATVLLVLTLGFAMIFRATPLDQMYGRLRSSILGDVMLGEVPRHSVLVGILAQPSLERVARLTHGEGITRIDGEDAFSQRGTLATFVKRLAGTHPASLGFDISFEQPADQTHPAGTRHLAESLVTLEATTGLRAVAIRPLPMRDAREQEATRPQSEVLSELLLPAIGATGISWGNLVTQYIYQREAGALPRPTLALAMLGAKWRANFPPRGIGSAGSGADSGALRWVRDDSVKDQLHLECVVDDGGESLPRLRVRLSDLQLVEEGGHTAPQANPGIGLDVGEEVGLLYVPLPGQRYFRPNTIDLLDALDMDDATFAERFSGKYVFVANLSPQQRLDEQPSADMGPEADFIQLDDGRTVPGVYTHIATLEALLSGRTIIYLSEVEVITVCTLAAVIGAAIAIRLFRRTSWMLSSVALMAATMVAGSLLLFARRYEVINPLIPVLAMLVAAALCWLGLRIERPSRHLR